MARFPLPAPEEIGASTWLQSHLLRDVLFRSHLLFRSQSAGLALVPSWAAAVRRSSSRNLGKNGRLRMPCPRGQLVREPTIFQDILTAENRGTGRQNGITKPAPAGRIPDNIKLEGNADATRAPRFLVPLLPPCAAARRLGLCPLRHKELIGKVNTCRTSATFGHRYVSCIFASLDPSFCANDPPPSRPARARYASPVAGTSPVLRDRTTF